MKIKIDLNKVGTSPALRTEIIGKEDYHIIKSDYSEDRQDLNAFLIEISQNEYNIEYPIKPDEIKLR